MVWVGRMNSGLFYEAEKGSELSRKRTRVQGTGIQYYRLKGYRVQC